MLCESIDGRGPMQCSCVLDFISMSQEQRNDALPPVDELFPEPEIRRGSDGWLDLRGCDLRNKSLAGRLVEKVRFGDDERPWREPARLIGVSFRGSRFKCVTFTHV